MRKLFLVQQKLFWILLFCFAATSAAVTSAEVASAPDISSQPGEDWGPFLGPEGNGRSGLTDAVVPWPSAGPPVVWHCALGQGYCAPAVARGRAVVFDRTGETMRLRCLEAETGRQIWERFYPADYTDTFGYDGGPRASPVIVEDRVLTFGPEGRLECRALLDGASLWHVDSSSVYHVVKNFFGVGAAPLVVSAGGQRLVVVRIGGSRPGSTPSAPDRLDRVQGLDSGLVAFDLVTGRECWRSSDQLASYSAPMVGSSGGKDCVLAWLREKFLVIDPASGAVLHAFRWRADELFSVVAASPVSVGEEVLLSETYGPGSVLLDLKKGGLEVLRKDPDNSRPRSALKAHWATPIFYKGHLYGSSGRNSGDAQLVCADWKTGTILWSEPGLGRSSAVLVGSSRGAHLIVLGEFGDLVLVKAVPEGFLTVSRSRPVDPAAAQGNAVQKPLDNLQRANGELLAAPCWAAPVVAHGYLYVRGEGRLVCLDLREKR